MIFLIPTFCVVSQNITWAKTIGSNFLTPILEEKLASRDYKDNCRASLSDLFLAFMPDAQWKH